MKPRSAFQRRQAHRRRKTLARTRHQLQGMIRAWGKLWSKFQRGVGPQPPRIKLPYVVRQHKRRLYGEMRAMSKIW